MVPKIKISRGIFEPFKQKIRQSQTLANTLLDSDLTTNRKQPTSA
jgi:hypothetical protein